MRLRSVSFAIALLVAGATPAAAYTVRLDYRNYETAAASNIISQTNCGVSAATVGVSIYENSGVGVWGGNSHTEIDGGEGVSFGVQEARALRYYVGSASNLDGDGLFGEHFLEGFGPGGASLGVVARSGVGTFDATAAFGGASLKSIEITAQTDGLSVGWIEYDVPPGRSVVVRFLQLSSTVASQLEHCGLTVTSSTGTVAVTHDLGAYAKTGVAGTWTEPGHWLDIAFDTPVSEVGYQFQDVFDNDGDFVDGEHFVEAFGASGASLGIRSAQGTAVDLSQPGYFGSQLISRIVVTAADSYRIDEVTFMPEPAGAPLAAAAALALAARRRRRLH